MRTTTNPLTSLHHQFNQTTRALKKFQLFTCMHFRRYFSAETIPQILECTTSALESAHQMSGVPWYFFIPATTIAVKSTIQLPLAVLQRKRLQKQNSLRPIVSAMGPILRLNLARKAQQAQAMKNDVTGFSTELERLNYDKITVLASKERRKRQKQLFKDNKCQVWKNAVLPLTQLPVWLTLSLTFRDLTGWHQMSGKPLDPSLTTEGFSWITDLTLPDPYMTIPVVLGCVALSNIEWNTKALRSVRVASRGMEVSKRPTLFDAVMNISRLGVILLMCFSTQAPAALGLYWISSQGFSLVQNMLLDKLMPLSYKPDYSGKSFKSSGRSVLSGL